MKMTFLNILLADSPVGGGSSTMMLVTLVLIVVVFYFFMIRPQVKRQKEAQKFRNAIQKGDKVVTIGGIYGKVVETSDNTVILEVEDKMRLKIDKSALNKDASGIANNQK